MANYTLFEKQCHFSRLVALLILKAAQEGYGVTLGEAYRTPEQAKLNAQKGSGIANSLHIQRLAIDLQLFKNGVYLSKTEEYQKLGEYWESLASPGLNCTWGGRFKSRPDGGHFSIEHNGVK